MKTNYVRTLAAALAAGVILTCSVATAQMADNAQPVATVSTAPQLPYGANSILQLSRANVGDDTIINYIKNSGNSYGLNADQIIYLRQQGVSSAVINAMLNQPKPGVLAATPTTTATQPAAATVAVTPPPATTTTVAPTVTYVQTVPATTYYYYQPYYYPAYGGYYGGGYGWPYPAVSLSFGWGGHWGGGWHGGWGGGWHGGWHGGGGGGWHGGGWHR